MRLRIAPSSRPEQLRRILDGLARLLPYQGLPMSQLLAAERQELPLGATVIYIGAETVVDVPTIVALRQLHTRGYVVSLLLTEPDDAEPAEPGALATVSGSTAEDGHERHELHLSNLPTHYLGGRREWQALVTDVLGTNQPRNATTPLNDDIQALELRLVTTTAYARATTDTAHSTNTANAAHAVTAADTTDDTGATGASDGGKGGARDEPIEHTDANTSDGRHPPTDQPDRAARALVVR
ncbi:MAG: hypothetical protein ABI068_09400 [Ktedonobacterales bacterium]